MKYIVSVFFKMRMFHLSFGSKFKFCVSNRVVVARGFDNFRNNGNSLWHKDTGRILLYVEHLCIAHFTGLHRFSAIVLLGLKT